MSKSTKTMLALCVVAFAAACAKKEEAVFIGEPAVSVEPAYTGKYK
jgi:hypothetical protein